MSDREPRKRKKRREGQKKEDLNAEEVFFPSKKQEEWQKDSEPEPEEETVPHEPSVIAKFIFFLIFSLLIVATGAVFIALRNADRSIGIISDSDTSHGEVHTEDLPISFTEDLKPEVKEGLESELWIEENLPNLEILQEEEMPSYQPSIDDFTEIIHEEKEPEEPEISPQIDISEKEPIDFSLEDNEQIYYETTEETSLPIMEETLDIDRIDSYEDKTGETEEIFTHSPTEHYDEPTESEPFFVETEEKETEQVTTVSKEDVTGSFVEEAVTEESNKQQQQSEIPIEYEQHELPFSEEPEPEMADVINENDFQFGDDIDKIERIIDKEPEEDDIYFWF